jgi:hypothetical protein
MIQRPKSKLVEFPTAEKRISKSELDTIGRALRANVKAAKHAIAALGPKLKAEFDVQLMTKYPASGDPVWKDAMDKALAEYEIQSDRVRERCKELGLPERFWPSMRGPGWMDSWSYGCSDYKDMRAEMRRVAGIQIDDMLKSRVSKLELDSANIQFEIATHGCITDAAKDFLARLPKIEEMIPPVKVSEVEAMIEGKTFRPLTKNAAGNLELLEESEAEEGNT